MQDKMFRCNNGCFPYSAIKRVEVVDDGAYFVDVYLDKYYFGDGIPSEKPQPTFRLKFESCILAERCMDTLCDNDPFGFSCYSKVWEYSASDLKMSMEGLATTNCLFKYRGILWSFDAIKKVVTSRGAGYAGHAVLIYLDNLVVIDGVPNPTITLDFKYLDDAEECISSLQNNLPNVFNKIVSSAERYKLKDG